MADVSEEWKPICIGDYFCLMEDIKVLSIDHKPYKLEKYSLLQALELEEDKTILYSVEYDFKYNVGGIAYGLFPKDGEGVGRYQPYKDIYQMASPNHDGTPITICNRLQCWQESDEKIIENWINQIINQNSKEVEKYRQGNKKLIGSFVGQIMKLSKNRANPSIVNKLLEKILNKK